jgi:superfamily II DNA or RNA helicase
MKLRDHQRQGAAFFAAEIAKGGDVSIGMPVGAGRTIIMAEIARTLGRPVAFMSRIPEMREQMKSICDEMGVENVTFVGPRDDVSAYGAVILSEELRDHSIDHPSVIRQAGV